jgi:phage/plasmid-associated DNA primase
LELSLNVPVNDDQFGIHFANGRYDLREKKFAARLDPFTSGLFVTKWINYDFTTDETTESLMQTVHGTLSKIFLEPDALEYITFELAKSIVCAPVDNCYFLFLVGEGSAGKSTLTKFLNASFTDAYCKKIPSNAFSGGNREAQVLLNTLEPHQRFLFLDAPPNKRLSSSILKTLCDGEIECRVLYSNGSKTVKVNAKLMITSNHILNFDDDDTGIRRRILYYECKSKFTHDADKVNNVNVFPAETFPFDTLTDIERYAIFLYFVYKCPYADSPMIPPPCFMIGENVPSFRTFAILDLII